MYEVLEVMKGKNYKEKIFPAVTYSEIFRKIGDVKCEELDCRRI